MDPQAIRKHYDALWMRLQGRHNAIDFYEFDELHYQIFGHMHPLCYYKRILMRKSFNIPLKDKEIHDLKKLTIKYGKTDITYLIPLSEMPDELVNRGIIEIQKNVYDGISDSAKDISPAFSEYLALLRSNLEFSFNNSDNLAGYNRSVSHYLNDIDHLFKEWSFIINENLTIRLTPSGLIHILAGHTGLLKIPRKGLLVDFNDIDHWIDVLSLLNKVIQFIKNEIRESFEKNKRYDNRRIFFQGKYYGLHIQKNKVISTFYPVVDQRL
jgi:hypothetical protein